MYLEKKVCLLAYLSYYRLWGRRLIYITIEGLYSSEATPNLDVIYKRPNHATILFSHLSYYPLATFKALYFIFIFKRKAYKVIAYAPYPYHEPEMVSEETLF